MSSQVIHSDCLLALRSMPDDSVDSIISDPPAGIAFMGKEWDNFSGVPKTYDSEAERNKAYDNIGKGASPYGFSGASLKPGKKERNGFIAFMAEVMTEALRVLKPGGHALIWSLPRTSHWTATALEDSGFEIRDKVYHLYSPDTKLASFQASLSQEQRNLLEQVIDSQETPYSFLQIFGSGFPKSLDISKQLDKMQGMEREVIGVSANARPAHKQGGAGFDLAVGNNEHVTINTTAPASEQAIEHAGKGTALKPACEEWILCRKPISEKNIAANVLLHGTGALNIDESRIGYINEKDAEPKDYSNSKGVGTYQIEAKNQGARKYTDGLSYTKNSFIAQTHVNGRFPSHLLLSHTLFCTPLGTQKVKITGSGSVNLDNEIKSNKVYGTYNKTNDFIAYKDANGLEEIDAYDCSDDCPVRLLNEQSGASKSVRSNRGELLDMRGGNYNRTDRKTIPGVENIGGYNDQGGASRYFKTFPPFLYAAKASRRERSRGCDELENGNNHCTVKSQALMQYLVRMITPHDGIVLDMFAGSGSTGVACVALGLGYILIEQSQEYIDIINARLAYAHNEVAS